MFRDGDLYERSFDTPAGRLDVLAEIVITGSVIELRDIAIYPSGTQRVDLDPTMFLRWARQAVSEFADEGFSQVSVTGVRLSGARPGRRVRLVIRTGRENR
jgi:hypothetical protein